MYTHYHGTTNTYACIDKAYTNTKMRPNIRIKHIVYSFSDNVHAVLLERKNKDVNIRKEYWILNNALLNDKEYKNTITLLWNNWRSQKHWFNSVSQSWEKGKKHVKDFTKLYTRATTKQKKQNATLEKRLRNIYTKIDKKPELQTMPDNLRIQLFNIEIKEAQGTKVRSRIQYELEGEK